MACSEKDFTGFTDVYSTRSSFMARNKLTGQALCWGNDALSDPQCAATDWSGFDIHSNREGYLAINKITGQAHCFTSGYGSWHERDCGNLTDFDVYGDWWSLMVALNQVTGECVSLDVHVGPEFEGYPCPDRNFTGFTVVKSNYMTIAAVNPDTGEGVCWGRSESRFRRK